MKRLVLVLVFSAALSLAAVAQIGGLSFPGPGPLVASGGTTFAQDGGSTSAITSTSNSTTLTTTQGNGTIVVGLVTAGNGNLPVPSASGLIFTQVGSTNNLSNGDQVFMWTAPYATNFSGSITITFALGSPFSVLSVMGISDAKSSSPNDAGGPVNNTSSAPSMTTLNANDCVIAFFETNGVSASPGSGWTASPGSNSTNFVFMEYQFVTSTGTFTATMSAGTIAGGTITGIQKGP